MAEELNHGNYQIPDHLADIERHKAHIIGTAIKFALNIIVIGLVRYHVLTIKEQNIIGQQYIFVQVFAAICAVISMYVIVPLDYTNIASSVTLVSLVINLLHLIYIDRLSPWWITGLFILVAQVTTTISVHIDIFTHKLFGYMVSKYFVETIDGTNELMNELL